MRRPAPAPACPTPWPPRSGHARGFTLVEVMTVTALVGVLASLAWPSYLGHLDRARRGDAVLALTRVQAAQEQHRVHHGRYADTLAALVGTTPRSAEGHYDIAIEHADPDSYVAQARVHPGGAQARDAACPQLTLTVRAGLAEFGPAMACWGR